MREAASSAAAEIRVRRSDGRHWRGGAGPTESEASAAAGAYGIADRDSWYCPATVWARPDAAALLGVTAY